MAYTFDFRIQGGQPFNIFLIWNLYLLALSLRGVLLLKFVLILGGTNLTLPPFLLVDNTYVSVLTVD